MDYISEFVSSYNIYGCLNIKARGAIGPLSLTWDQVLSKLVLKSLDNNWQWVTFSCGTYISPWTYSMTIYIKYFNSIWEIYILLSLSPYKKLKEANMTLQYT